MERAIVRCLLFLLAATFSVPASVHAAPGDLYATKARTGGGIPEAVDIVRVTPAGAESPFSFGLFVEGLTFDRNGNLFVANVGSSEIVRINPAGTKSTFASGVQAAGLAFDRAGNLFAAVGTEIDKFSPNGTKTVFASGLAGPFALAFDFAGNLFVGDLSASTGQILKFTPSGGKSVFATGLKHPVSLAFDQRGVLFVADGAIFEFTPSGGRSTFASGFGTPESLAFDKDGNLFVSLAAMPPSGAILEFAPSGTSSTFASGPYGILAFAPVAGKLQNVSARAFVGTGDHVLIGGFILGGNGLATNAVLVRGIGPSLSQFGVTDPLADPTLELHNGNGALIARNNNWQDTQAAQITATGLAPPNPLESAIFATLPAGDFTAVVRGVGGTTGTALVEVYSTQ